MPETSISLSTVLGASEPISVSVNRTRLTIAAVPDDTNYTSATWALKGQWSVTDDENAEWVDYASGLDLSSTTRGRSFPVWKGYFRLKTRTADPDADPDCPIMYELT